MIIVLVFLVQITDYGLPSFLSGQSFDENEQDMYRRELSLNYNILSSLSSADSTSTSKNNPHGLCDTSYLESCLAGLQPHALMHFRSHL